MRAYVGQAILHGCVAAAFVEALLRSWRVHAPSQRIALRFLALLSPLALPPVLAAAAPYRRTPLFTSSWALFAGGHWDTLQVGSLGLAHIATIVFASAGLLLFLRDAVPFVAERMRPSRADTEAPSTHAAWARLSPLIESFSASRPSRPALRLLETPDAVLFASGVASPVLTISTGTCDRLDDDELRAAIAHELAHLRFRDPGLGWVLLALRAAQCFNPAAQIVGRQIVEEIEIRSDRDVAAQGMAPSLARAIVRLSHDVSARSDLAVTSVVPAAVAAWAAGAVAMATDDRCERLLVDAPTEPGAVGRLRVALAAGGLVVLLFLTV